MDGAEGEDNAAASHFEVYSSSSAVAFAFRGSSALSRERQLAHFAALQVADKCKKKEKKLLISVRDS